VREHALHGIGLVARAAHVAREGLCRIAVGVDEIRIVVFDHVHDSQRPPRDVPVGELEMVDEDARAEVVPLLVHLVVDAFVLTHVVDVEHAWVHALPPFAHAVCQLEADGIVGHAQLALCVRGVGSVGALPPPPRVLVVEGHAEAHALSARRRFPFAQDVALGAELHGIPRLIAGIPVVELIVMHALDDQEARTGVAIGLDQRSGIERRGVPRAQQFLVADHRGMAEIPDVVRVGSLAFDVELSRVPVAALSRRLRSEVNPDSELRFAQPSRIGGRILSLDGIPGGLERTRGDGKVHLHFGKLSRVAHGDRAECLGCWDIRNGGQGRKLEAAVNGRLRRPRTTSRT
jgi:hypothetical protein